MAADGISRRVLAALERLEQQADEAEHADGEETQPDGRDEVAHLDTVLDGVERRLEPAGFIEEGGDELGNGGHERAAAEQQGQRAAQFGERAADQLARPPSDATESRTDPAEQRGVERGVRRGGLHDAGEIEGRDGADGRHRGAGEHDERAQQRAQQRGRRDADVLAAAAHGVGDAAEEHEHRQQQGEGHRDVDELLFGVVDLHEGTEGEHPEQGDGAEEHAVEVLADLGRHRHDVAEDAERRDDEGEHGRRAQHPVDLPGDLVAEAQR